MKKLFITLIVICIYFQISYGNEIKILYTANVNATYKDCNCGKNPLGGLNRIKTYIDDFRSQNKNYLFIDGGNFFNSYQFTELNEITLEAFEYIKYDLLTFGVHIFTEPKSFFNTYLKSYQDKIINSNSNIEVLRYKDFEINKVKLRFYSYISPKLFKHSYQPEWLNLNENIDELQYLNDGINILIYNGFKTDAEEFLKSHNEFDIIFLSYDQQQGIWNYDNTKIIGSGHDAESIALVKILLVDKSLSVQLNYIEMDKSIQSNELIMSLFKKFEMSHN